VGERILQCRVPHPDKCRNIALDPRVRRKITQQKNSRQWKAAAGKNHVFLPAADAVMFRKKAPWRLFSNGLGSVAVYSKGGTKQPAKVTPFAGGNEAAVLKKAPRRLFSNKKGG
jgi:hypothetical protein